MGGRMLVPCPDDHHDRLMSEHPTLRISNTLGICVVVLILFLAGDPDLLDAIINWISRH